MSNPTDPESLFNKARTILNSDFGIQDPSLLSNDFIWFGPSLYGKGLKKEDYLAAGNFFDLRSTFPDLDYRAHDFRMDSRDSLTVRLTARTVGTMRGDLRLRTESIPANGKRMVCPPEAISMTFDKTGEKLVKLCTGYSMDRLVGNTNGQCGVRAAATIAGIPPSEWDIYPPSVVISRFFGRNIAPIDDNPANYVAPFPETVMIQLAKGVLAADNGASDPDLLASSFTFCGPYVGPLKKERFVKAFSNFNLKEAFPDLDAEYSNFRVDPFDPYRVWVDARGSGTNTGSLAGKPPTNNKFQSPPEAASLTFDDDGFCTRLTGGAVMDPTIGNTGGLGGVYGIFYGIGEPLPDVVSRPIPEIIERLKKTLASPFTGLAVDDYGLPNAVPSSTATTEPIVTPVTPPIKPETSAKQPSPPKKPPTTTPLEKTQSKSSPTFKISAPKTEKSTMTKPVPGSKEAVVAAEKAMKAAKPRASINILGLEVPLGVEEPKVDSKKDVKAAIPVKKDPAPAKKAPTPKAPPKTPTKATLKTPPKAPEKKTPPKAKAQPKTPTPGSKEAKASAEKAMKAAKPRASINIFTLNPPSNVQETSTKPPKSAVKPVPPASKQEIAKKKKAILDAEKAMQDAKPRATIPLFGIGSDTKPKEETTTATKPATANIPSLKNWGVNKDKSITGMVYGSAGFRNGVEITTSTISSGEFKAGSVVTTSSGSRYLLK